ncbi:MAG TPA: peptidoglycan DD-metalloendopeptidase family protein [Thermoleophilaceae bacterium]
MALRAAVVAVVVCGCLAVATIAEAAGSVNVAALQVALQARGLYAGTIDGISGPGTRRGVRALERRAGLRVDGIVGPLVRHALGRLGRHPLGSRTMRSGDVGWDVAALQFRLAWRGFPSGNFDGGFGPHLQAAVTGYQRWAGLSADGVAGPATLASLRAHPIPRSPLRLARPVGAPIGDGYGPRGNRFHSGLDFLAGYGAAVHAAGSGTVAFAGYDSGGYGNLVVIHHSLGVSSWYAHLSRIDVRRGERVGVGALIGRVGATGDATGPHLHFEVRLRGADVNPLTALG